MNSGMLSSQRESSGLARAIRWGIAVAVCALVAGCGQKDIAPPPPTPAIIAPTPAPPRASSDPVSEPQIIVTLPPEQPIPPDALSDVPAPLAVDPPRQATEPAERENPATVPGEPAHPAEPASTSPPSGLRLGRILSLDERKTFNASIDQSLSMAQRSLAIVLRRNPTPDQTEAVKRVRAFVRQAQATRKQDLPLAKNLAERAKLLAEDLARSVQ